MRALHNSLEFQLILIYRVLYSETHMAIESSIVKIFQDIFLTMIRTEEVSLLFLVYTKVKTNSWKLKLLLCDNFFSDKWNDWGSNSAIWTVVTLNYIYKLNTEQYTFYWNYLLLATCIYTISGKYDSRQQIATLYFLPRILFTETVRLLHLVLKTSLKPFFLCVFLTAFSMIVFRILELLQIMTRLQMFRLSRFPDVPKSTFVGMSGFTRFPSCRTSFELSRPRGDGWDNTKEAKATQKTTNNLFMLVKTVFTECEVAQNWFC